MNYGKKQEGVLTQKLKGECSMMLDTAEGLTKQMTKNSIRFSYLEVICNFENDFMEVLDVQTRLVWFEE